MYSALDECECTIDYTEDAIIGQATKMNYVGGGVYVCPKCNDRVDYSEDIFRIRVEFKVDEDDDEDFITATIIGGEERINHHWNDSDAYLLIKTSLQGSLYEDVDDDWRKNHELGIFDIEIYCHESSYYTDCGTEYDVEVFIVSEVKL